MKSKIAHAFFKKFNTEPTHYVFSPGRVNLIGEHTDYSGGVVFPMALSLGIEGAYSRRSDDLIRVYSSAFPTHGILEVDLTDLTYKRQFSYGNYVQGVLKTLREHGFKVSKGFDLYLHSTLPPSSGLSSSAALEMAVITVVDSLETFEIDALKAVKLAKQVENDYMGIASGIMDQFAVRFGKADHALLLDTSTLDYGYAPFPLKHQVLYLMNTNKTRDLEESDYNERFDSVHEGMRIAQEQLGVETLGDVPVEALDRLKRHIKDATVFNRVRHVVEENRRTKEAYEALKAMDYTRFGALMDASHRSLKTLFEVSCEELDFLVEENKKNKALGARMTGAGFGGTMIALYEASDQLSDQGMQSLKDAYKAQFGKTLDVYQAKSSDGVYWERMDR